MGGLFWVFWESFVLRMGGFGHALGGLVCAGECV